MADIIPGTTNATDAANIINGKLDAIPLNSIVEINSLAGLIDGVLVFITDQNHGGEFVYDTSILKTAHNGGTIFDTDIDMTTWTYTSANAGFGVLRRTNSNYMNVRYANAKGDGVTDDSLAFSNAIFAAEKHVPTTNTGTMPFPTFCSIIVPDGEYLLSSLVKNYNSIPTFILSAGAKIINSQYLDGRIDKEGQHVNTKVKGIRENSSALSTRAATGGMPVLGLDNDSGTFGISSPSNLGIHGRGDSVSFTTQNIYSSTAKPSLSGTVFTGASVAFSVINNTILENITIGSILYGESSGALGAIESISLGVITVKDNWYAFTGTDGSLATPIDGETLIIDSYDKIWGINVNCIVDGADTTNSAGIEIGMLSPNLVTDGDTSSGITPYVWGSDVVNLSSNMLSVGSQVRKNWRVGFQSLGPSTGFATKARVGLETNSVGFSHQADGAIAYNAYDYTSKVVSYVQRTDGSAEYGHPLTGTLLHDYKTLNPDHDVRFQFIGGNSTTVAEGTLQIRSSSVDFKGPVRPITDNLVTLGQPALRWSTVYAGTGTINTSDDREKTYLDIDSIEINVALELKTLMKKFKFNDAIDKKGSSARIHFGASAQTVKATFEKYGLIAEDYAILCYDTWEEVPEIVDTDGNVTQEYAPSGNRYGLRYDELLSFIISAL